MRIMSPFRRPTRRAGTSRHTILRSAGAAATGVVLTILAAVTATPAIAVEPFHFSAVLRSGKKVGDLVPGISALNDVVKMFPAAGLHDVLADSMTFLPSRDVNGVFQRGWLLEPETPLPGCATASPRRWSENR